MTTWRPESQPPSGGRGLVTVRRTPAGAMMQPDGARACFREQMDDDDLVRSLATDLDGAFEALVRAHQDRLYSISLRLLGDPDDAEEVAQDAFVRAYRAMSGWDAGRFGRLQLRPWLASIVVNLSRNRRRRAVDRRPPLRLAPLLACGFDPVAVGDEPEARRLRRAEAELWAERLLRCPPALRTAIVLRHVDGLSYEEIAQALGRPVGTVKAQVHRGLARLRAELALEIAASSEVLTA
jgi:RNA polymerase sigma-70 factor (ECF subfamily)